MLRLGGLPVAVRRRVPNLRAQRQGPQHALHMLEQRRQMVQLLCLHAIQVTDWCLCLVGAPSTLQLLTDS